MERIHVKSWQELKQIFQDHSALPRERRSRFVFRGQANSVWPLQTTMDRLRTFPDDDARTRFAALILQEFRAEALGLSAMSSANFPAGDALDLLARHHGLPSTMMDWTYSPFIAAFFAYSGALSERSPTSTVWILDRTKCKDALLSGMVDIIDDRDLLRFNVRALEQRGLFLRVLSVSKPLEERLDSALTKLELAVHDVNLALSELDSMNITAKNLFRDLDAAAKTVVHRILSES